MQYQRLRYFVFFECIFIVPGTIFWIYHNGMQSSPRFKSIYDVMKEIQHFRHVKRIYCATNLFGKKDWRQTMLGSFSYEEPFRCQSGHQCQLTRDRDAADGVLFHGREIGSADSELHSTRKPSQRWIFLSWESIVHADVKLSKFWNERFNWTATYMRNSDVVTPYYRTYVNLSASERNTTSQHPIYDASKKSKFAFAVISNCDAKGRMSVVRSLRRFMSIDVFGRCGKRLGGGSGAIIELSRSYRFYLAFENSLCKDYITEKFWNNGLRGHAVPVAYGGFDRSEYDAVAPPHSFVYAGDFKAQRKLADFLKSLSENEKEYARYFEWKKKFKVSNDDKSQIMMCRVCNRLHTDPKPSITDVNSFWNRSKYCH